MIAHQVERRGWFIMGGFARHERGRAPPQHLTRSPPRGHGRMDLQYANWERFCRYHVGDWYGLWTNPAMTSWLYRAFGEPGLDYPTCRHYPRGGRSHDGFHLHTTLVIPRTRPLLPWPVRTW